MGNFWIGLIVGAIVYVFSALFIGSKASALHYILVFVAMAASFVVWVIGEVASEAVREFCSGFWVPIFVVMVLRFGAAMLPSKSKQAPTKYIR